MDVTELPYNAHLGIERSRDSRALLELAEGPHLHNHLGTFHAAALFSLAEASSAEFLLRHRDRSDDIQGVVRRAACKYSSPATGTLTSHSLTEPAALRESFTIVDRKGRALFPIEIELRDESSQAVASFTFTWFLARKG